MTFRIGEHSIFRGFIVQLLEARHEDPIPFTHFILSFQTILNYDLPEFKDNKHDSKILLKERAEIKNAFRVSTKALYRGEVVLAWTYDIKKGKLGAYVKDDKIGTKLNFFKLSDRYIAEIDIEEIEKIWEERGPSDYDLPMPENLQTYHEIDMSRLKETGMID